MKNIIFALAALYLSGCGTGPVMGAIYTDIKGPIAATSNAGATTSGEACASSILSLVATGDASIETAKHNAGIQKVAAVDHTTWSILGLYTKFCTIVHGSKKGGSSGGDKGKGGKGGTPDAPSGDEG